MESCGFVAFSDFSVSVDSEVDVVAILTGASVERERGGEEVDVEVEVEDVGVVVEEEVGRSARETTFEVVIGAFLLTESDALMLTEDLVSASKKSWSPTSEGLSLVSDDVIVTFCVEREDADVDSLLPADTAVGIVVDAVGGDDDGASSAILPLCTSKKSDSSISDGL